MSGLQKTFLKSNQLGFIAFWV